MGLKMMYRMTRRMIQPDPPLDPLYGLVMVEPLFARVSFDKVYPSGLTLCTLKYRKEGKMRARLDVRAIVGNSLYMNHCREENTAENRSR
jgi:hypothetical protein